MKIKLAGVILEQEQLNSRLNESERVPKYQRIYMDFYYSCEWRVNGPQAFLMLLNDSYECFGSGSSMVIISSTSSTFSVGTLEIGTYGTRIPLALTINNTHGLRGVTEINGFFCWNPSNRNPWYRNTSCSYDQRQMPLEREFPSISSHCAYCISYIIALSLQGFREDVLVSHKRKSLRPIFHVSNAFVHQLWLREGVRINSMMCMEGSSSMNLLQNIITNRSWVLILLALNSAYWVNTFPVNNFGSSLILSS
ncbi:hypothetical protein PIB30_018287 [Stylosanthes scabra]|uniref:Uncharacterized protein n=1 Tax=Stylosanthes scabra TaxID=79078 RepID=A0ABU6Y891_9FABA|nr:hypothetical protein [Stylosanthes scabra]